MGIGDHLYSSALRGAVQSDAARLVAATDIEHAYQVAAYLQARGESCCVVTSKTPAAQEAIDQFRHDSQCRWMAAVGVVAEGTDIPRLQVCCHLSRVRTELHFRQVLGRVLRRRGDRDPLAWLFMLAEPELTGFAQRVSDDLPDDRAVVKRVSSSVCLGPLPAKEGVMAPSDEDDTPAQRRNVGSTEPDVGEASILFDLDVAPRVEVHFSRQYREEVLSYF